MAPADEVAEVLKTARANGKAVVGMKIFGAGKLVKPEEKDASLKYVFTNELVDAVTDRHAYRRRKSTIR